MTSKTHFLSDLLAIASIGLNVVLKAWQEQLDWALRAIAALVAIAAGLVAIWSRLKAHRQSSRLRDLD